MKQIKLFSVVLLLATMFLSFNACSDDDDDNPNNRNKSKKITKIVNVYGMNDDDIWTDIFLYSKGKMSKYTAQYRGEFLEFDNSLTITYSGNTVIMDGILDGRDCVQTYTLNDKGLAISCKISPKDKSYEEKNYIFQYFDGYLIGLFCTGSGYTEAFTFTCSNGNIVNATELHSNEKTTYTFTYSDNENKGGIMSPILSGLLFNHKAAYYMGILGKATKNLAVSCSEKTRLSLYDYTCVYSLDNDGYVTTAISSLNGKFTYTFE